MSEVVAVTGATGHVGSALARQLRARGAGVRVIGRSAGRLQELVARGAEARVGSVEDVGFLTKAFEGAAAVFAMIPPDYATPDHRAYQRRVGDALATALQRARVPRAVTLSSLGAERDGGTGPIAGLHDLETRVEGVPGLHALHLRPAYFMENHLHGVGQIRAQGIYGSPIKADRAMAMIATRDIGGTAAEILAKPSFTGRSYRELLGPRDYTMREATRILGESIGRPDLPYLEFSYDDTRKALVAGGFSPDVARLFVEMYEGINGGRVHPIQGRQPETTTPTTLPQFAKDAFGAVWSSVPSEF